MRFHRPLSKMESEGFIVQDVGELVTVDGEEGSIKEVVDFEHALIEFGSGSFKIVAWDEVQWPAMAESAEREFGLSNLTRRDPEELQDTGFGVDLSEDYSVSWKLPKVGDWTFPYKKRRGTKAVQITKIDGDRVELSDGSGMHISYVSKVEPDAVAEDVITGSGNDPNFAFSYDTGGAFAFQCLESIGMKLEGIMDVLQKYDIDPHATANPPRTANVSALTDWGTRELGLSAGVAFKFANDMMDAFREQVEAVGDDEDPLSVDEPDASAMPEVSPDAQAQEPDAIDEPGGELVDFSQGSDILGNPGDLLGASVAGAVTAEPSGVPDVTAPEEPEEEPKESKEPCSACKGTGEGPAGACTKCHGAGSLLEVSPPGWSGTVKAMKDEPDIDNPFALAWSMKNKGYKSHKKPESVQVGSWGVKSGDTIVLNTDVPVSDGTMILKGTIGSVFGFDENNHVIAYFGDRRVTLDRMAVDHAGVKPSHFAIGS